MRKILKTVLFTIRKKDGTIEDRTAYVYELPMLSALFEYSAGDRIQHVDNIKDESMILDYTPHYVALEWIGEFKTLDDVRHMYEWSMQYPIVDWFEF